MTTGAGRDSERFAAAVENGQPYEGAVLPGDEHLDRELELVALLRESRASLAPSSEASARMRARVMASAATMMPAPGAELEPGGTASMTAVDLEPAGEDADVVPIGRARARHRFPSRVRAAATGGHRGALGVSAAAALMVLAVTGGGALFSQDALPGDSLYGVKQTTESGLIALTPGQNNKAQRQLDVAATRIDEVQALNSNQRASADRGTDISQALRGFNEQASAGSRSWLAGPGANNPSALATWANTQSQRLSSMRSSMPASSQSDADSSMQLLDQLRTRANALNSRKGCDTVTSGEADQFGPVPAKGACSSKDSSPQTHQVLPTAPTREHTNSPLGTPQDHTQVPATGGKPGTPGLQLPTLPGNGADTGGVLPNRESTNGGDTAPAPGLLNVPLLGN